MVEMLTLSFDEQVTALVRRGVVDDERGVRSMLDRARPATPAPRSVLTLSRDVVPVAIAASQVERQGRPVVFGQMAPDDLDAFVPIDAVRLPDAPAYLAIDVNLGADSHNVRPEDALREIVAAGRSPLTLDEGIALVLQQPEVIAPN
jgi:hypothetical protein